MRYVAGISVRQGSVRFPNKAMALVCGIPSFAYCYWNAKRISGLSGVYVLTNISSPDIVNYCRDNCIPYWVSESESDVIGRYLKLDGDIIVRITGDDIFPCQEYFNDLAFAMEGCYDYAYFGKGHIKGMEMEMYTRRCLERVYSGLDTDQKNSSEYMSWYFRNNPTVHSFEYNLDGKTWSIELDTETDYRDRVLPYAKWLNGMGSISSPNTYRGYFGKLMI